MLLPFQWGEINNFLNIGDIYSIFNCESYMKKNKAGNGEQKKNKRHGVGQVINTLTFTLNEKGNHGEKYHFISFFVYF